MAVVRSRSPPSPATSLSRERVPLDSITSIDAALKLIRNACRRLSAVASSHELELAVLVKLHYKNNNQHRSAVFWRKVKEVKRFAARLEEIHLSELLEQTRQAFHAQEVAQQSIKKTKSAWTRCPDASFIAFVLERIHSTVTLIDLSRSRYEKVYTFLTRATASGAFLALMLMLSSITARLALLLTEMRDALHDIWNALKSVYDIVQVIAPTKELPPTAFPIVCQQQIRAASSPMLESLEDTGEPLSLEPSSTSILHSDPVLAADIVALLEDPEAPHTAQGIESQSTGIETTFNRKPKSIVKKKKKKRSVVKDEIDLIFG